MNAVKLWYVVGFTGCIKVRLREVSAEQGNLAIEKREFSIMQELFLNYLS